MATYAHPEAQPVPDRERCETLHSPGIPARCRLARNHEGDCRFGPWSDGARTYYNLDLPLPVPVGRRSTGVAESGQRYTASVMWTDADGAFVDSWTHATPDTLANVLRMLAGVAERDAQVAHVRIEPVRRDEAAT